MAPTTNLDHLANPLVTAEQLYSLHDDDRNRNGNGQSLRYAQAVLTQSAGVLLRLPQVVIATSLVLLQRFWVEGHGQGNGTADSKVIGSPDTVPRLSLNGSCRQLQKHQSISLRNSPSHLYLLARFATSTPICSRDPLLCRSQTPSLIT